ncbi:F-box domain containing protein [Tanacetum coccineum]
MSQLARLANFANFVLVKDMMVKLFEVDNERDFRIVRETYAMCQALNVHCEERREQIIEMELMKSISETQLKVLKKTSFIAKLRQRLPVILEGAKVFDKKGINQSDYCIRFKLGDSVPKHGGIFGDCGVWVCIFLYRLSHGLSLDVEDPVDVALAYRKKMVLFFSQNCYMLNHFSSSTSRAITVRALDELAVISGETKLPNYTRFFLLQQVAEAKAFAKLIREKADNPRACFAKLVVMIGEIKAMDDKEAIRLKEGHMDIMDLEIHY